MSPLESASCAHAAACARTAVAQGAPRRASHSTVGWPWHYELRECSDANLLSAGRQQTAPAKRVRASRGRLVEGQAGAKAVVDFCPRWALETAAWAGIEDRHGLGCDDRVGHHRRHKHGNINHRRDIRLDIRDIRLDIWGRRRVISNRLDIRGRRRVRSVRRGRRRRRALRARHGRSGAPSGAGARCNLRLQAIARAEARRRLHLQAVAARG
jgi:hypothetical protein